MKKLLRIEGRKAYRRYLKAQMNKPKYDEIGQIEAVVYTSAGIIIGFIIGFLIFV